MVDVTATQTASATPELRRHLLSRWRPFVDQSAGARHRRPADVISLVLSLVLLAMVSVRAADPPSWETDVADFFAEAPGWLDTALEALLLLGSLWAVVFLVGGALLARRWRLARDLALAGFGTWGIAWVLGQWVDPARSDSLGAAAVSYPVVKVAVVTALVVTAQPYLVRPVRRAGAVVVVLAVPAALVAGAGLPLDVLGAIVLGIGVASAVHVALGSPAGLPTIDEVVEAAADLGVVVDDPRLAPDQPWGEVVVTGRDLHGDPVRVKALGRDSADVRLLNRAWHRLWYRDSALPKGKGLDRVNDEALVTLLAERAGASVPTVVAVGGDADLALLVERTLAGRPLASLAGEELTDDVLRRVWASVGRLHGAGLSHGSLHAGTVLVGADGAIELGDLGHGRTPAPKGSRATDVAELLVSTALLVGPARAVAAARSGVGDGGITRALAYLQPPALSPALRDAVAHRDKADRQAARAAAAEAGPAPAELPPPAPSAAGATGTGDLKLGKPKPSVLGDIRREVLAVTGAGEPELVKLQRITPRGVAMIALTLLGVYFLMSQFSSIEDSLNEMKGADLWWVAATLLVGQLPEMPAAYAALGSVNRPIPYGPTVVLEYAEKFVGLVVPSTVGITAMHARYLNQVGVPVATAITAGVLVSVGGFVVQICIFIPCLLLTGGDLSFGNIDASDVGWAILIGAVAVGVVVTLVYVVPKLRRMIVPRVKQALGDVTDVLRDPSKAFKILVGNLGAQLLYAICLGLALQAYGYSLSLPALLVVNTASSLFAGMMPVPGGIGVAEASLAAGMIAYGIPASVAGAAALTQRLATFYLPPIWGWVAFRWLSKRQYI